MPFLEAKGVRFYFEDSGEGPAILVAHGLFGSVAESSRSLALSPRLIAGGFRVVEYDARGHGLSEGVLRAPDFRWRELARDLEALLDGLGIERAVVVGSSMGAGVALVLSLLRPDRVSALVLRHPPPLGDGLLRVQLRMAGLALCWRLMGPERTSRLVASGNEELRHRLASQRKDLVVPAIQGLLFSRPQLADEPFSEVAVPTLILTQPGDVEHPVRSGELLGELIADTDVRCAQQRDHWRGDALAAEVLAFLERHAEASRV